MSLTSFVVSRNWASNRLRLLLTLVGIALGVGIVVAIYVMDHNTIQSRLLAQDPQRGRVDLEVAPVDGARPAAEVAAELRATPGVQEVAQWREALGRAQAGSLTLDLAVYGLGPLPPGPFDHYDVAAGRNLAAADDGLSGGILLGREAARLLGVTVGDHVRLGLPPRYERVECRDGKLVPVAAADGGEPFAAEVEVVGLLGDQRLGRRNFGQVAVTGLALAHALQPRGNDLYHVLRAPGTDLDRLRQDLGSHFSVRDLRGALIGEGADERAFRNGLKVLGGLALLLGMFVVFQTLSHALVARIKQLGLLRCLGAGSGAITRIFLFDALLLGVVGSVLGVGVGMGLALWLKRNDISSLGVGKAWSTFEIPIFPVAWTAALGVLFTLAGAMFPLVRARQVPALDILQARGLAPGKDDGVDLLRGINVWMFLLLVLALPLAYLAMTPLAVEEGAETRTVLLELGGMLGVFGSALLLAPQLVAWLGRLVLLPLRLVAPLSAWLVGKAVARSPGRIAAAVCGLAAVGLALLGLKSVTWSLHAEVSQFARAALDDRLFIQPEVPQRPEAAAALAKVPGVARVDVFEGEERGVGFLLRGLDVRSAAAVGGALEGRQDLVARYADDQARTMVVSRRLAKARHWQTGSLVSVLDKNRVPVAYEVMLVGDGSGFDGDERAFAVASPHWLRRDFCIGEACVEHATLLLAPGADGDAVAAAARGVMPLAKAKTGAFIRGFFERDVQRDFRLFDLLLFLMLVLAGIGLLNGMTIAALGRVREIGVLRALGIRRAALVGSFVVEGVMTALLASLLALALAVPMAYVLVLGMNHVAALDAPVALPYAWFLLGPAALLLTGILAASVPAVRVLRQSPSESVRYE